MLRVPVLQLVGKRETEAEAVMEREWLPLPQKVPDTVPQVL